MCVCMCTCVQINMTTNNTVITRTNTESSVNILLFCTVYTTALHTISVVIECHCCKVVEALLNVVSMLLFVTHN